MKGSRGKPPVGVDEEDVSSVFLVVGRNERKQLLSKAAAEGHKRNDVGIWITMVNEIKKLFIAVHKQRRRLVRSFVPWLISTKSAAGAL